ncbi:family 43 glycosylhydrolase [Nonomuraea sp. GTA35]|uniref:family 43 glycosylhydrolase n=1 Tax=Nonomuraea sp. GTA35 TaxID=1676746 RepID=UPI0035C1B2D3
MSAARPTFRNPVVRGIAPDPSVCRVGDDYYLANSTVDFWPGIAIRHSTDLVHWDLIGYAATRPEQFRRDGAGGPFTLFAPTLRHHDGTFFLACTNNGDTVTRWVGLCDLEQLWGFDTCAWDISEPVAWLHKRSPASPAALLPVGHPVRHDGEILQYGVNGVHMASRWRTDLYERCGPGLPLIRNVPPSSGTRPGRRFSSPCRWPFPGQPPGQERDRGYGQVCLTV